jgi:acyl-CoA thioesterase FadM
VSVKTLKFTNPARLGDLLEVSVQPSKKAGGGFTAKLVASSSVDQQPVAIASATSVMIATGIVANEKEEELYTNTLLSTTDKVFVSCFRLWPDEMVCDMSSPHAALPTRTVFNLLERGRSNMLGGPQVLAQSASAALHYYVARVSDYRLSFVDTVLLSQSHGRAQPEVWVKVYTTVTPVGAQLLDFDQQIVLCEGRPPTQDASQDASHCYAVRGMTAETGGVGKVVQLARARVTVACVDAVSGSPALLPPEIQALLQ